MKAPKETEETMARKDHAVAKNDESHATALALAARDVVGNERTPDPPFGGGVRAKARAVAQ